MAAEFTTSEFFRAYAPRLKSFLEPRISPKLRPRFDADDVIQSAFRSFFLRERSAPPNSDDWNPWPLLVEIAVHKLARQVRRNSAQRRSVESENSTTEISESPNRPDELVEVAEIMQIVSDALSAEERQAWELRIAGWELQEIAAQLGISERTVRRYLAVAKSRLETLLHESAAFDSPRRASPIPTLLGESLRDYLLQQQIGVGAVGKVYRAVQKPTGKTVAIKFLKKSFTADTAALESILSEMSFGLRLRHPALVHIDGIGKTPNEGLFLVMEYLPGGNLADWLRTGRPDWLTLKAWLLRLADGLEYAHQAGVLHCDLKPANVLFDADGQPKIGDFGLAQRISGSFNRCRGGTPAYLAPELLDPTFGNPGPWTDVFGLGAILYAVMTGQPPYACSSAAEFVAQIVSPAPIPWPATIQLPPHWQQIGERCLAKSAGDRFASIADLRQALRELPVT